MTACDGRPQPRSDSFAVLFLAFLVHLVFVAGDFDVEPDFVAAHDFWDPGWVVDGEEGLVFCFPAVGFGPALEFLDGAGAAGEEVLHGANFVRGWGNATGNLGLRPSRKSQLGELMGSG